MPLTETIPFGLLLKQLRKRMGMTQRDLAAALNYSDTLICNLEKAKRLPDLDAVITRFVPALGLQDDPAAAAHLVECAAAARGERPPAVHQSLVNLQGIKRGRFREEVDEQPVPLSSSPTELIGRTAEVEQLCNRLLGHSGRLLTLVGPPGIGKSSLALAVATRLQHHYAGGAVFVALAEFTDPVLVAAEILAAVGSIDASSRSPKSKLIERLRRKTMLLVLDNCEQIRDAAPLVAELLAACAGITILATSRERLHLRAEQRHHVPPLELRPAVELFSQRAAAVDARFELTDVNRPMVEAICQRLDRLPLALELCAAQTNLHSLAQLLAQLQDRRLDLLVDGAHDLPPQQRTLRRAIQRSYALLSEEERRLFRSLGVFVGGFDLGAVEMIGVSSLEADMRWESEGTHATLHALIGKSMVHVETLPSGEQRFRLLETLREFALEQLHAHDEVAEMRQRHYGAYLQRFRTGDSHLRGPEAASWVARLKAEQDNLRAALQWMLDTERYADMAWLHIAADYFWFISGQEYEVQSWLPQLLSHRQTLAVDLRLAILIQFLANAQELEDAQGMEEFPSFAPYIAEVTELMEICPHVQLHASFWYYFAWNAPDGSQTAAALAQALTLAQKAGDGPSLGAEFCIYIDDDFKFARIQWGYGAFLIHEGETEQATALITDSLQRFRQRGNQAYISACLGTLGLLALFRGDVAEAHTLFQEVITIGTTYGLPVELAMWQPLLGIVTLYGGHAAEAHHLLTEGLRVSLEIKNVTYLARACTYLAELALWEGDTDEAADWLGQSLAYQADRQQFNIHDLQRLFAAARLATTQGQYRRAAMLLGFAEVAHRRIHYVYAGPMLPLVNAALSNVREALGAEDFDEAFTTGQHLSLSDLYTNLLTPVTITNTITLSA